MTRISRCRSCQAKIVWARNRAGRRLPVDIERSPTGNLTLTHLIVYDEPDVRVPTRPELDDLRRQHVKALLLGLVDEPQLLLHTSHLVTCPYSDRWRERRTKAAA